MLKYALLGMLNYQPMTGYQLKQFMDNSTKHLWYADQSQIYRTLKSLTENKLLNSTIEAQDGRPDKRIYLITELGQADFLRWLAQPVTKIEAVKDTVLLKLFFSGGLDKEVVLTHLRLQRALYQQQQLKMISDDIQTNIEQTKETVPELRRDALMWEATRRFGEQVAELAVSWLDETIVMVETEF